jgi:large subunit ribosomal protein L5
MLTAKSQEFAKIQTVALNINRRRNEMARLKDYYNSSVAPAMMKKFGYKSVMEIPKLDKVIINVGAGEARDNAKIIDAIMSDIALITGQKPVVCRAKKSIANFKLREGMPIGVKVTLRSEKMYEFVDRLFNVAFPRVRDFRGINGNSFDGRGNYSTGIKEQLIFPVVEYDKIDKFRGMDINFITTANTDEEAKELLTLMGAPFTK